MSRHDETQWRAQIKAAHRPRAPRRPLSRHYRRIKPRLEWNALPVLKVALVSALALVVITEVLHRLAV